LKNVSVDLISPKHNIWIMFGAWYREPAPACLYAEFRVSIVMTMQPRLPLQRNASAQLARRVASPLDMSTLDWPPNNLSSPIVAFNVLKQVVPLDYFVIGMED